MLCLLRNRRFARLAFESICRALIHPTVIISRSRGSLPRPRRLRQAGGPRPQRPQRRRPRELRAARQLWSATWHLSEVRVPDWGPVGRCGTSVLTVSSLQLTLAAYARATHALISLPLSAAGEEAALRAEAAIRRATAAEAAAAEASLAAARQIEETAAALAAAREEAARAAAAAVTGEPSMPLSNGRFIYQTQAANSALAFFPTVFLAFLLLFCLFVSRARRSSARRGGSFRQGRAVCPGRG